MAVFNLYVVHLSDRAAGILAVILGKCIPGKCILGTSLGTSLGKSLGASLGASILGTDIK